MFHSLYSIIVSVSLVKIHVWMCIVYCCCVSIHFRVEMNWEQWKKRKQILTETNILLNFMCNIIFISQICVRMFIYMLNWIHLGPVETLFVRQIYLQFHYFLEKSFFVFFDFMFLFLAMKISNFCNRTVSNLKTENSTKWENEKSERITNEFLICCKVEFISLVF